MVSGLFHFTDASNLSMIRRVGSILSLDELERRGLTAPTPGGNRWSQERDRELGISGYVHCSVTTNHPMAYVAMSDGRIPNCTYLVLDPGVLAIHGVRVAPRIANASGVPMWTPKEALEAIDWLEMTVTHRGIPTPYDYIEILVPSEVPLRFVTGRVMPHTPIDDG